jgi:hypothetical protein
LILVEMQKEIQSLKARISELEEKERPALSAPNEKQKD